MSLLEVDGLRVRLPAGGRLLTVVDGVDYRVEQGEVFGVAGECGSGKTMSMLALLGVLPDGAAVEGSVRFDGRDLLALAPQVPVRTTVTTFPLERAEDAIDAIRSGSITGAAVVVT